MPPPSHWTQPQKLGLLMINCSQLLPSESRSGRQELSGLYYYTPSLPRAAQACPWRGPQWRERNEPRSPFLLSLLSPPLPLVSPCFPIPTPLLRSLPAWFPAIPVALGRGVEDRAAAPVSVCPSCPRLHARNLVCVCGVCVCTCAHRGLWG